MNDFESLLLLLSIAVLLVSIAQKMQIAYPIALVIGGAFLSFIPGIDFSQFDPDLILAIVLPPILYHAAFWTSVKDFKNHAKKIGSLAFGLVVVTTLVIGVLFKWCFPQFPWALAFAFGAIVSPPDAVAATSILKKFPLGQKLTTILEGESLVNDASALVLYRIAVAAILSGTFSFWHASIDFVYMSTGGVLLGASIGYLLQLFSRRYLDSVIGTFFSFLIPYIIFTIATIANTSGVLAVVASGVIASRMVFRHQTSLRRLIGRITWDMYVILLNCFVFILIGSQLDEQTKHMSWNQIATYTAYALLMTIMMFIIRILWACVKGAISFFHSRQDPKLMSLLTQTLREGIIIGWVGMRGIVSLTAALALPFTLNDGTPLAGRSEIIYMVFCIILFTLILPGLTLRKLISKLNLPISSANTNSIETRRNLAQVALDEIQRLHTDQTVNDEERSLLHDYFNNRFRLWELVSPEHGNLSHLESARKKVVDAQRKVLLSTWEKGSINDKTLAQIEHELDSEETQTARAEI